MKKTIIGALTIFFVILLFSPFLVKAVMRDSQGWDEQSCGKAGGKWYQYSGKAMCVAGPLELDFNVPFPNINTGKVDIALYMKTIYKFGVGAAAILAVMMIMIGGVLWMTAGGNQERVTSGRTYITGAIVGLVIALGSYTMLRIVNPSLVMFTPMKIQLLHTETLGAYCPPIKTAGQLFPDGDTNPSTSISVCGKKYHVGSADGKSCMGWESCSGSQNCLPQTTLTDGGKYELKYSCTSIITSCQSINDNVTEGVFADGLDLKDDQTACNVINSAAVDLKRANPAATGLDGSCTWINYNSFGSCTHDGCGWCDQETRDDFKRKFEIDPTCSNLQLSWRDGCFGKDDSCKISLCAELDQADKCRLDYGNLGGTDACKSP